MKGKNKTKKKMASKQRIDHDHDDVNKSRMKELPQKITWNL